MVRKLKLLVDDRQVAKIAQNTSVEIERPDTGGTLTAKMDWATTQGFPLAGIEDGASITVTLHVSFNPLRNVGILPLPATFLVAEETRAT